MERILSPTILIGLYGRFSVHPWIDPGRLTVDAYGLFYARSVLMSVAGSAAGQGTGGLWEMNEAGQDWEAARPGSRVAWFQVGLPPTPHGTAVLPAFAVITVGAECLRCVGTLDLAAVQILLPLQVPATSGQNLSVGVDYFRNHNPALRSRVHVELDAGDSTTFADGRLEEILRNLNVGPTSFTLVGRTAPSSIRLDPEDFGDEWLGSTRSPESFGAWIPAWNVDAIAWLIDIIVYACRRLGVSAPVLITVTRVDDVS